jgi:hypothetical protein
MASGGTALQEPSVHGAEDVESVARRSRSPVQRALLERLVSGYCKGPQPDVSMHKATPDVTPPLDRAYKFQLTAAPRQNCIHTNGS